MIFFLPSAGLARLAVPLFAGNGWGEIMKKGKKETIFRVCKLCQRSRKLSRSHILPRSFYRRVKGADSQIYAITAGPNPTARQTNGDQIQHLLCEECEGFICKIYEDYGTQLFVDPTQITENADNVYILRFQYEKYYLFIISIIWRAAVSTLDAFKALHPLASAEKVLRHCLLRHTLEATSDTDIRLDDFIKITTLRLTDPTGQIPQDVLDRIMYGLNLERGESIEEGLHFYLVIDGYLIVISMFPPRSETAKRWEPRGKLRNRKHLKIPKVPYYELSQIREGIESIANARDTNGRHPSL